MAFYSGSSGELYIDGTKAAKVSSWQFSANLATLEATSLADTDRVIVPGVRSTSGSCSLFYYTDTPNNPTDNSAHVLLNKLIKQRTTGSVAGIAAETTAVTFKLRVADGTTDGKYITFSAYITSADMQMAVGQVLSASINFEVIGAPTEVTI